MRLKGHAVCCWTLLWLGWLGWHGQARFQNSFEIVVVSLLTIICIATAVVLPIYSVGSMVDHPRPSSKRAVVLHLLMSILLILFIPALTAFR